MDPMNINKYSRGSNRGSNYRLLGAPLKLTYKRTQLLETPGSDTWEDDGGAVAPPPEKLVVDQRFHSLARIRGPRKQRAARAYVPKESIRVVTPAEPAPMEVVAVRLAGGSEQDEKVAALEARIKKLMDIVQAPVVAEERRKESIARFEKLFNQERKVR